MNAATETEYLDTQTRLSRLTLGIVHDPLTGLRSHVGLLEEIARNPSFAERIDTHTSIVVSVPLPATYTDKILALVGMRISRSIRAADTAVHLGSGEFVIIVADDAYIPLTTAMRLSRSLSSPYVIDGRDVCVRYKIGFARLLKDGLFLLSRAFDAAASLL